jgi:hypothetical protein
VLFGPHPFLNGFHGVLGEIGMKSFEKKNKLTALCNVIIETDYKYVADPFNHTRHDIS